MNYYVNAILLGAFLSSVSQVMLKKSAMRTYETKIQEYVNPLVVIAYGIFFGTIFLSIYAYKGIPLSMGPVLETTSYIYVTAFGAIFFQEKINRQKILALLLIVGGVLVYSLLG